MADVTFYGTTISDGNVSFDFTKGVVYTDGELKDLNDNPVVVNNGAYKGLSSNTINVSTSEELLDAIGYINNSIVLKDNLYEIVLADGTYDITETIKIYNIETNDSGKVIIRAENPGYAEIHYTGEDDSFCFALLSANIIFEGIKFTADTEQTKNAIIAIRSKVRIGKDDAICQFENFGGAIILLASELITDNYNQSESSISATGCGLIVYGDNSKLVGANIETTNTTNGIQLNNSYFNGEIKLEGGSGNLITITNNSVLFCYSNGDIKSNGQDPLVKVYNSKINLDGFEIASTADSDYPDSLIKSVNSEVTLSAIVFKNVVNSIYAIKSVNSNVFCDSCSFDPEDDSNNAENAVYSKGSKIVFDGTILSPNNPNNIIIDEDGNLTETKTIAITSGFIDTTKEMIPEPTYKKLTTTTVNVSTVEELISAINNINNSISTNGSKYKIVLADGTYELDGTISIRNVLGDDNSYVTIKGTFPNVTIKQVSDTSHALSFNVVNSTIVFEGIKFNGKGSFDKRGFVFYNSKVRFGNPNNKCAFNNLTTGVLLRSGSSIITTDKGVRVSYISGNSRQLISARESEIHDIIIESAASTVLFLSKMSKARASISNDGSDQGSSIKLVDNSSLEIYDGDSISNSSNITPIVVNNSSLIISGDIEIITNGDSSSYPEALIKATNHSLVTIKSTVDLDNNGINEVLALKIDRNSSVLVYGASFYNVSDLLAVVDNSRLVLENVDIDEDKPNRVKILQKDGNYKEITLEPNKTLDTINEMIPDESAYKKLTTKTVNVSTASELLEELNFVNNKVIDGDSTYTILLADGTYEITDPIRLYNIIGNNKGQLKIEAENTGNAKIKYTGSSQTNCFNLENVDVTFNGIKFTSDENNKNAIMGFNSNLRIGEYDHECTFDNFYGALFLMNCNLVTHNVTEYASKFTVSNSGVVMWVINTVIRDANIVSSNNKMGIILDQNSYFNGDFESSGGTDTAIKVINGSRFYSTNSDTIEADTSNPIIEVDNSYLKLENHKIMLSSDSDYPDEVMLIKNNSNVLLDGVNFDGIKTADTYAIKVIENSNIMGINCSFKPDDDSADNAVRTVYSKGSSVVFDNTTLSPNNQNMVSIVKAIDSFDMPLTTGYFNILDYYIRPKDSVELIESDTVIVSSENELITTLNSLNNKMLKDDAIYRIKIAGGDYTISETIYLRNIIASENAAVIIGTDGNEVNITYTGDDNTYMFDVSNVKLIFEDVNFIGDTDKNSIFMKAYNSKLRFGSEKDDITFVLRDFFEDIFAFDCNLGKINGSGSQIEIHNRLAGLELERCYVEDMKINAIDIERIIYAKDSKCYFKSIDGNSTSDNFAAIYLDNSYLKSYGGTIHTNGYYAVMTFGLSNISLQSMDFINDDEESSHSALIYMLSAGADNVIYDCTFDSKSADNMYGIVFYARTSIKISHCNFDNCPKILHISGGHANFYQCNSSNDTKEINQASYSTVVLNGVEFNSNVTPDQFNAEGICIS